MRVMALIERFTLKSPSTVSFEEPHASDVFPGLKISIRSTTSSMKDYPEWRLDELTKPAFESVVSDGACS
jgi:hypothetical protein